MNWYIAVLKNYVGFDGRAQRAEYWYFTLVNIIATVILSFISPTLQGLYALAVFLPSLAVAVRRFHDTDKTGWWLLLAFIPLFGVIVLIIFMVQDGTLGGNKYGPNPKDEMDPLQEDQPVADPAKGDHTSDSGT